VHKWSKLTSEVSKPRFPSKWLTLKIYTASLKMKVEDSFVCPGNNSYDVSKIYIGALVMGLYLMACYGTFFFKFKFN